MDNDQPRADHAPADHASVDAPSVDASFVDDPYADGRNVLWLLDGFDADDEVRYSRELNREEYLRVRPLFEGAPEVRLGDDVWMLAGDYRVPLRLWEPLWEFLGPPAGPAEGLVYLIGARQDFPDGRDDRSGHSTAAAAY
ncbi:hypothetical protein [Kitasatospora sp. NPDC085464]|uniref:hypothetical protein n=1 Tax=Kitasatospora sp. NPDC085464 TaxID=3364063 RepID=UPI0037C55934